MSADAELYRKLVEASADGLWLLDETGRTLLYNPRMAELLGRTPEQMEGLSAFDVHDEVGKVQFAQHLAEARAGHPGHFDREAMYLKPDGTPVWVLVSFRPVREPDGTLVGFLHQYSDYTETHGLVEQLAQREQLAAAQQIARIGSWEWDVLADVTTWSDQLYETYGIDPDHFGGDYDAFLEMIHPDDREAVRRAVAATFYGPDEFEWTARVIRGDGEERWCRGLGRVERGPDGAPVRMTGTNQDITEQVRAEREIAEARDQAMEASRLKSEFLATMSHEIRTPMNGVIGLTDLLLRTDLDAQQLRLARALHGAGLTLRGLINDILDLSKIEAGKLELELVDFEVRPVVQQAVGLLRTQADDKGLALDLVVEDDVPTYVCGDSVRWSQVLSNLTSNAVKFTEQGTVTVRVRVADHRPRETAIEVEVSDTGPGIAPEDRQRLFEAFTQADRSTTRRHGGTGLGLAIARRLVDAMGGELELTSEVERGSSFRFTTGFGKAFGDSRRTPDATLGHPARGEPVHRILVVEDNHVNQLVAVGLLEHAGYAADVADDGAQAVAALTGDHGYSAVLMDCRMPRMDGFEATREVRAREPDGVRVPIVAMTASALQGERERCLEAGMDDFLTKPVDSDRLHRVIRHWVSGAGRRDGRPADVDGMARDLETGMDAEAPVVDQDRIEMLHEMVKDGVSLFERSSGNFLAHAPDHLAAIGAAVAAADGDQLMQTAHKLKGSALNLGLARVGAAAYALEEQGRHDQLAGAMGALATLTDELRLAVAALEKERAARAPG